MITYILGITRDTSGLNQSIRVRILHFFHSVRNTYTLGIARDTSWANYRSICGFAQYRRLQWIEKFPFPILPRKSKFRTETNFSARKIRTSTIEICTNYEGFPLVQKVHMEEITQRKNSTLKNKIPFTKEPQKNFARKVEKGHVDFPIHLRNGSSTISHT